MFKKLSEGSQFVFVSTGEYLYHNGPVQETSNTRVSNGTPVLKISKNISVQSQKLLHIFGH